MQQASLFDATPGPTLTQEAIDALDNQSLLNHYCALLKQAGRSEPTKFRPDDMRDALLRGLPPAPSKRGRTGEGAATAFDRILTIANTRKTAPGIVWEDASGAVRYTSWAWVAEANRWSYRLACRLGIYQYDERGNWRYHGEDHLDGLDTPDHPLHDTWVRERRAYLDTRDLDDLDSSDAGLLARPEGIATS